MDVEPYEIYFTLSVNKNNYRNQHHSNLGTNESIN